jgi:hypothetical protein
MIDSYNPSIPELKIKLNFSESYKISNGTEEDILEAVIIKDIYIQIENLKVNIDSQTSTNK